MTISAAREFEGLVRDAVKSLPREFKRKLENINIVILEEPSVRQKKEAGTGAGEDLLGLYEGVPLLKQLFQNPVYHRHMLYCVMGHRCK